MLFSDEESLGKKKSSSRAYPSKEHTCLYIICFVGVAAALFALGAFIVGVVHTTSTDHTPPPPPACVLQQGLEGRLDEIRSLAYEQQRKTDALSFAVAAKPTPDQQSPAPVCDVCEVPPPIAAVGGAIQADAVVLGAGAAGLYQAWTLVHELGVNPQKIILIDAKTTPGGRIVDTCVNGDDSKCFGRCALRINEAQVLMRDWARKLGVVLEWNIKPWKFIQGRGGMVQGTRPSLGNRYSGVINPSECSGDAFDTTWGQDVLYWYLRPYGWQNLVLGGNQVCNAPHSFPLSKYQDNFDMRTYQQQYEGNEPFLFKRDWLNFRSLTADGSANGTLEWLKEELITYSDGDFYPRGGWSEILDRAYANLTAMGVRTSFMGDPVSCVWHDSGNGIIIRTQSGATIRSPKVFNSIPPTSFDRVGGSLATQIKADAHYKSIKTVKVVTITVWWSERFWEAIRPVGDITQALRKIYFITEAEGECFSRMEVPSGEYLYNQNVTRAVYDDGVCVSLWERLIANNDNAGIMKIIKQGVRRFLDNAGFSNVTVPNEYHVDASTRFPAWHILQADSPYTNCEQEAWGVKPLPGQGFHLIGEAYAPQHMGWNNHVAKMVLRATRKAYPTFNYNHLLGAKVCQDNEHITVLADPNNLHSAHLSVPYSVAAANPVYAAMIASDGPKCKSGFSTPTHDISCQNLVDTDPCHDLFIGNDPNKNNNCNGNHFDVFVNYLIGRTDGSCTATSNGGTCPVVGASFGIASAPSPQKIHNAVEALKRRI